MWGRDDHVCRVGDADVFARLIAGSRVVVLDNTGHAPMLERPNVFNELLLEFVGSAAPAPASRAA